MLVAIQEVRPGDRGSGPGDGDPGQPSSPSHHRLYPARAQGEPIAKVTITLATGPLRSPLFIQARK